MINTELIGVLTVKNKNGELIAVAHNSDNTHDKIFYSVKKMGMEEIKQLLDNASSE